MGASKQVIIAFLGKSKYTPTVYLLNGQRYPESLAFKAIHAYFSPVAETFVIGTSESRWEMLAGFPHIPVIIPYGRSEEEFWQVFDVLAREIDTRDSEIIFDFTHGFRVLPFFAAVYVRFLRYVEPTATIKHIFYGSFEQNQPDTPIVDVAPIFDLLDWTDAASAFVDYGELGPLARRMRTAHDRAHRQGRPDRPRLMGTFSRRLEKLSGLFKLTTVPLVSKETSGLAAELRKDELGSELERFVKPFAMLTRRLRGFLGQFEKETLWETQLEVAKWYHRNERLAQALIVLREVIVTARCEARGLDPDKAESRKQITEYLNEHLDSPQAIAKLWSRVIDKRNPAGHAYMARQVSEGINPGSEAKKIEGLLRECESVFKETKG